MPSFRSDRPLPGTMPDRLPETAPAADFDAKTAAKSLLRSVRAGALATIDRNTGHPFGSLVNVATDSDGSALILISRFPPIQPISKPTVAHRCCSPLRVKAIRSRILD